MAAAELPLSPQPLCLCPRHQEFFAQLREAPIAHPEASLCSTCDACGSLLPLATPAATEATCCRCGLVSIFIAAAAGDEGDARLARCRQSVIPHLRTPLPFATLVSHRLFAQCAMPNCALAHPDERERLRRASDLVAPSASAAMASCAAIIHDALAAAAATATTTADPPPRAALGPLPPPPPPPRPSPFGTTQLRML